LSVTKNTYATRATAPTTTATAAAANVAATRPAAEVPAFVVAVADGLDPVAVPVDTAEAEAEVEVFTTGRAVSVKAHAEPVQRHVSATGSNQAVEQLVEMCERTPIAVFCDGTGLSGVGSVVGQP